MSYVNIFTGSAVQPAQVSYLALPLTADIELFWPFSNQDTADVVANLMDVTPTGAGLIITMPPANQAATGQVSIMRNLGAATFTVNDFDGNLIVDIASGEIFYLYITDNTTEAGIWALVQFGTGTSSADASSLAGLGLVALLGKLNTATPVVTLSSSYMVLVSDRATLFVWNTGTGFIQLPDASIVGDNFYISVNNQGTGALTIQTTNTQLIDNASTISLDPGNSCIIVSSGTAWYTIGLGTVNPTQVTILNKDVSGSANVTLTTTDASNLIQNYIGTLTGNISVIAPTLVGQYYVYNNTTGAFSLTVKTAAGTGITIPQGTRLIVYCDGTNIVTIPTISGTGGSIFSDALFLIQNATDPTKQLAFSAANISTLTTRTLTAPNASGTIALTSQIPLTTKGDILGFDTANNRIPVGTNNQVFTADSAQTLGVKWSSDWMGNTIPIAQGGTSATTASAALTALGAVPLAGTAPGMMSGYLLLNGDPILPLGAVTKQYADALNVGLTFKVACDAATTTDLGTIIYNNGTAGVGATITNNGTQAAFSTDGQSPAMNDRILVKNQTITYENGIYTLTTVGSGSTNWVLTRATDFDQPSDIAPGDFILVNNGSLYANTGWIETATVTTIGTDPILFSQLVLSGSGTVTSITAGSNLTGGTITTSGTIALMSSPSVSGSVTVGTSLNLPSTSSSTVGVLTIGNSTYLHNGNGTGLNDNLFVGNSAGNFTLTGGSNTGLSRDACNALTSGTGNVGIGGNALGSITTGNFNVSIGNNSGTNYTSSESSNICIGNQVNGTAAESNVLRIGNGTGTGSGNLNSAIICGISGITSASGVAVLINSSNVLGTTTSSRRFKHNIQDMGDASDRLMKLRPVTFLYTKDIPDATDEMKFGLIAEEVADIMPELAYLNANGEPETVRYNDMPAILLNELQKLSKQVHSLNRKLSLLEARCN